MSSSRYGGTIEKFIGDAVMAVWGTPIAREDDAERAVRAGLDLVNAVGVLGREVGRDRPPAPGGDPHRRGGRHDRRDRPGDGGRRHRQHRVARLQSVAPPGSVLVGESTRGATERAIAFESRPASSCSRAKAAPYPLWRALRVVAGAAAEPSGGLEAPFVGRDEELRLIKDLFHATRDDGGHTSSRSPAGGIGKSRLAWEFFKYIDGVPALTYWQRGRCLSYGEGVTYWALADLVRMRCRISEDEERARRLGKLADVPRRVRARRGGAEVRRAPRAHLLGSRKGHASSATTCSPPGGSSSSGSPTRTRRRSCSRTCSGRTTHCSTSSTTCSSSRASRRLFVLTLARPELQERGRLGVRAGATSLRSTSSRSPRRRWSELLAGLVPGLPEEVRGQILERAEGIPLYAVETVRMLLDRGRARAGRPGVYRPAGRSPRSTCRRRCTR